MKIAIVGAGAMGSLYGGKLSLLPGVAVRLIDIWEDHINSINEKGLVIDEGETTKIYHELQAVADAKKAGVCELVILFVKSTMTRQAVMMNAEVFGNETTVLTLQNGLGNVEEIRKILGEIHVIAGTTAHGATMIGPGHIRHAGTGKTIIGDWSGKTTEKTRRISELFKRAGLECEISENVGGLIWDKLMVNVGINPLTALTGLKNGELLEYPELEEILTLAVQEAQVVATQKGIRLNQKDPVSHTKDVCLATSDNRSSMLQDISSGKETEISMINGAIAREGRALGLRTPVNTLLTNLVLFQQRRNKSDNQKATSKST